MVNSDVIHLNALVCMFMFTKFGKPLPAQKHILIHARVWIQSDEAWRIAFIIPFQFQVITSECQCLVYRF